MPIALLAGAASGAPAAAVTANPALAIFYPIERRAFCAGARMRS